MHLQGPPRRQGRPRATGEPIGDVGDTGDARAATCTSSCGAAPGWYTGGAPVDPLAFLKPWDA